MQQPLPIIAMLFALYLIMPSTLLAAAMESKIEILAENIDVDFKVYRSNGKDVILWIAPDYGFRKGHHELAKLLSESGLEVWMMDVTEALFLTRGSSSMKSLTGDYISEAIKRLHTRTNKNITLMSSFYGAIPILRGARKWQLSKPKTSYLSGAILFSPVLYGSVPTLGKDPDYLPIADATNIPIMIFQGGNTGMRWQLKTLLNKLHKNNSPAYSQIMTGITSLFYKEKRAKHVERYFKSLPLKIKTSLRILKATPSALQALSLIPSAGPKHSLDIELRAYKGSVVPYPIMLNANTGKNYVRDGYKGKVTLINFWATWCPPCVEEIPSLNDLQKEINHPDFEILSINFAESREEISSFLTKIKVDYPILMDLNGDLSRKWKVIVFPSTFIIGRDGKIKYGVNAAIDWNTDKTRAAIRKLLK